MGLVCQQTWKFLTIQAELFYSNKKLEARILTFSNVTVIERTKWGHLSNLIINKNYI